MFLILTLLACLSDPPVAVHTMDPSATDRPVWMFQRGTSGWTRSTDPVAHRMSSLGLGTDGTGLVLTANCYWKICGSVMWRHLVGPPVHGLRTTDLSSWTPVMWRLVDPQDRIPIDTEIGQRGEHTVAWYFGTQPGVEGDPALHQTQHTLFQAQMEDDRLVDPKPLIVGSHLADPSYVRFQGADFLFMTTMPGGAVGLARGDPLQLVREWRGVSVPHAMVVGKELWLWAHQIIDGLHVPVRSVTRDGESWSDFSRVLPTQGLDCANPVGIVWKETPVVFCVSEPLGEKPGQ